MPDHVNGDELAEKTTLEYGERNPVIAVFVSIFWWLTRASRSTNMSVTLKKVKGSLERVFEKNLQDLVRGIRSNKDNEVRK